MVFGWRKASLKGVASTPGTPYILPMIRIAITEAALGALAQTLPEEAVLHVDRRRGQCFIHITEATADRLATMRGPGGYSDAILRLVGLETKGRP
jgi:hypothetical protein